MPHTYITLSIIFWESKYENKVFLCRSIRVVAKIESLEALQKLEEIIEASDGVMIARVDLGVEIPLEQIPTVQEEITQVCRQLNKPVIVASQLLESMIEYPTPTRAEVLHLMVLIILLTEEDQANKFPF